MRWINITRDIHNLHRYKIPSYNLSIVFKTKLVSYWSIPDGKKPTLIYIWYRSAPPNIDEEELFLWLESTMEVWLWASSVVHPGGHVVALWWMVCDTNPRAQHSQHGPGPAAQQQRKPGEPLCCTESRGFSHHLAICYLLKFPALPCQDKSGNIQGSRAVQQRPGEFSLKGKFAESLGVSVHWLLRTVQWILSKLEFIAACLASNPASQKGSGWVIVPYKVKAEMQHYVLCKKNLHQTQNTSFGERFSKQILIYPLLLDFGILNSHPPWFIMALKRFRADPQPSDISVQAVGTQDVALICTTCFVIFSPSLRSHFSTWIMFHNALKLFQQT